VASPPARSSDYSMRIQESRSQASASGILSSGLSHSLSSSLKSESTNLNPTRYPSSYSIPKSVPEQPTSLGEKVKPTLPSLPAYSRMSSHQQHPHRQLFHLMLQLLICESPWARLEQQKALGPPLKPHDPSTPVLIALRNFPLRPRPTWHHLLREMA
jgi:hypothetical protein